MLKFICPTCQSRTLIKTQTNATISRQVDSINEELLTEYFDDDVVTSVRSIANHSDTSYRCGTCDLLIGRTLEQVIHRTTGSHESGIARTIARFKAGFWDFHQAKRVLMQSYEHTEQQANDVLHAAKE